MLRFPPASPEPRLEMTPLLDVVFLLLTFFIFALVLMVRAEVLDITLPTLTAGSPAEPGSAITVSLDADGALYVNQEHVEPAKLIERIRQRQSEIEDAGLHPRLFVAADKTGRTGDLIALIDTLSRARLGDFAIVGLAEAPPVPDTPDPDQ